MENNISPLPEIFPVNFSGFVELQDGPYYEDRNILDADNSSNEQVEAWGAEIAKRCNKYPKLVEALKNAIEAFAAACNENAYDHEHENIENAKQLLTELE